MSVQLRRIEPEYVYVTIPAEYICVYHRILAMLADYGEDMLKNCKASCTERNSGVIECFNMFNAAVASRKLGKTKLAETLIKYIKAKINQIYKNVDNSTSFVFPVDENGEIKAIVSCGERPVFEIKDDDMALYMHKFDNGFDEHFRLGVEDSSDEIEQEPQVINEDNLEVTLIPRYEVENGIVHPCADLFVTFNNKLVDLSEVSYDYYFDDVHVTRFDDVTDVYHGTHNFKVVIKYNGITKIDSKDLIYETTNS